MLFSMGGLFSIFEGVHKLDSTEPLNQPLNQPLIALGILVFAIVAEGLSLMGCIKEVNKERDGRSFWRWFQETRQSELLVIFGEDLAALFGLVFALAAVSLAMVTGNPIYDAVGSIGIGVLLIIIAIFIGIEIKALIIGQGVEPKTLASMKRFLADQEEVEEVYNLLTLQMGSDVMVAVKAKMTSNSTAQVLITDINKTEVKFKAAYPQVLWLFFEPDIKD
jgi:divalent metal cation (Fe/Co/Zn/Cd) transporter